MGITEIVAILGLLSGITGTVLGVMNYLRDRVCVNVSLQWDMKSYGDPQYDANKYWGVITVTNTGRRPVHVSHVALRLPKGLDDSHLLVKSGISGKTLSEAAPSEIHTLTQDGMEAYADVWGKIVAQVSDSAGRVWTSKPVKKKPSWAEKKL
jgi:hypothetical protein